MSKRSPFFTQGLPLVLLVVGGSLGLSMLVQGKQEIGDAKKQRRSLTVREYDLEQDYKNTLAKLQPEKGYDIVRIPREEEE